MLSFIHKKEMLFSNINLKHIKKTEHSLSEDTGRIPYIYCTGISICTIPILVLIKLKCVHKPLGIL